MRQTIMTLILFILATLFFGCTFQNPEMPEDFSLTYSWNNGSLPPEYRYEYVITIGPGPQGELDYVPGYGDNNDVNRWVTSFDVTIDDLETLYQYFNAGKYFDAEWESGLERVGGSTTSILLTAFGKEHRIPSISQLEGADLQKVENAQVHIRSVVPGSVWAEMEKRQEAFESSQLD